MQNQAMRLRLQREGDRALAYLHGSTNQYHTIWIAETATPTPNTLTGLPMVSRAGMTITLIQPAPRVIMGAATVFTEGGAQEQVGDVQVMHVDTATWPLARLLNARYFIIDTDAAAVAAFLAGSGDLLRGEMYGLLAGYVKEVGHGTRRLILTRLAQPRNDSDAPGGVQWA